MNNNKALLIIDMQKGSFTPATPRFDTEGVVERINALSRLFRLGSLPIIFIQHDGSKNNEFIPQSTEWELLDELETAVSDIFVAKTANDNFYKSNLQRILKDLEIEDLWITGCATDFCVEATIQSALAKDYNITVVSDGHTTGERPHVSAENVIKHYNWVWQNMTPTNGKIEVKSFEVLKESYF